MVITHFREPMIGANRYVETMSSPFGAVRLKPVLVYRMYRACYVSA